MENRDNKDLVQKLKELNALIAQHIKLAKEDVNQLEDSLRIKRYYAAKIYASRVFGTQELSQQWRQHLN